MDSKPVRLATGGKYLRYRRSLKTTNGFLGKQSFCNDLCGSAADICENRLSIGGSQISFKVFQQLAGQQQNFGIIDRDLRFAISAAWEG